VKSLSDLIAQDEELLARHRAERAELQARYDAAAVAAFREKHPRKRKRPANAREASLVDKELALQVRAQFTDRAKEVEERQAGERKVVGEELTAAAARHDPTDARDRLWSLAYEVSDGSYRSQTAATRYAEGAAERVADDFRDVGIEVKVRRRPSGYEVWAGTDDVGVQAVLLAPRVHFVEVVRRCWARGLNPRVYFAGLDPNFEERHGFDYFGRMKGERS